MGLQTKSDGAIEDNIFLVSTRRTEDEGPSRGGFLAFDLGCVSRGEDEDLILLYVANEAGTRDAFSLTWREDVAWLFGVWWWDEEAAF